MIDDNVRLGFIGFGEAAQALAQAWREAGYQAQILAFDIIDKSAECAALNVCAAKSAPEVAKAATHIISAVTADQQLNAVRSVGSLSLEQRYLDINSVAPKKKALAAEMLGDGYIDIALLSPIHPARHESPFLAAGNIGSADQRVLKQLFPNSRIISETVGEASLLKMIRSIFVKGVEAVAAECALAAHRTGLSEQVFPSLDSVLDHSTAKALADYTMGRVAVHGLRRAAEMEEVCETLADLELPSSMSRGAVEIQRMVGELELGDAPQDASSISQAILRGLSAKQSGEE